MRKSYRRQSLLELFQVHVPEDESGPLYRGVFGWLCGYSADASFLNGAVERFSGLTEARRAYSGRCYLNLMLDRGNPQILPADSPGVVHFPLKNAETPFNLLHAKVAILGFQQELNPSQWLLRLIVSTGNWTRDTVEKSIDLAYSVDFKSEDLIDMSDESREAATDLAAARDFLNWLIDNVDQRLLENNRIGLETANARRDVNKWLDLIAPFVTLPSSRFIDNRNSPFLNQIPNLVKDRAPGARNAVSMGSGFYETSDSKDAVPRVLESIVDSLREAAVLTSLPEVDVYVNPTACQAVARSFSAFGEKGWTVNKPQLPEYFPDRPRSLHAKFIFSAKFIDNSEYCLNPWIYLGSGNLTGPGFTIPISRSGGNLEAGILLNGFELYRWHKRGYPHDEVMTSILPIGFGSEEIELESDLSAGAEMPDRPPLYLAPPIPFLEFKTEGDVALLFYSGESQRDFAVLDLNGEQMLGDKLQGFVWRGEAPRQVKIIWNENGATCDAVIPVIDQFGRIAGSAMPKLSVEDVWGQLTNFPEPPEEDDVRDEDEDERAFEDVTPSSRKVVVAKYPVRVIMTLIENIASKQMQIPEHNWVLWCSRLEQCLVQAAESACLKSFLDLGMNPISLLRQAEFRPSFAATSSDLSTRYEAALKQIEDSWGVSQLEAIGTTR